MLLLAPVALEQVVLSEGWSQFDPQLLQSTCQEPKIAELMAVLYVNVCVDSSWAVDLILYQSKAMY